MLRSLATTASRRIGTQNKAKTVALSSSLSSSSLPGSIFHANVGVCRTFTAGGSKIVAPPMVYISGEEMTNYAMELITEQWVEPYFDTSKWEYFDLSCKSRDQTKDKVLKDAVEAGKRIGSIFKEPTITPSAKQVKEFGLSRPLSSPNGAMRRGWNGITISRDTIHIEGVELGFKNPVLFERHAVGGEYSAGWKEVGQGQLLTTFIPKDGSPPVVVDSRELDNESNVAVVYHNPYDNVTDLGHIFFKRCLEQKVTPYVVTKKTVFKWQEIFWVKMKEVFDEHYKTQFQRAKLLPPDGELPHLISDAATMQIIRWQDGNFGMAAHNYDGDMLTDEVAQVHRSPGFITSNLIGKTDDGSLIKEFEASHGTVTDLYHMHLEGKETSLNPLGLVEALIGAMEHSAELEFANNKKDIEVQRRHAKILNWCMTLRQALHNTFRYGQGTRDMSGPTGFTTEDFIAKVAWRLDRYLAMQEEEEPAPVLSEPSREYLKQYNVDRKAVLEMFQKYDSNKTGSIDMDEFAKMLVKLGVAPLKGAGKDNENAKIDEQISMKEEDEEEIVEESKEEKSSS